MVVLGLPQCHRHGRRRSAESPLRHVRARLGPWHRGADHLVGDHALHAVADGGDARDGAREAVRQVPRARAARVRRQAWAVDRGAAAADRGGWREHRVHGDRREVAQEVPRRDLRRQVQGHQAHLLHHDLRVRALRPLPAPKLQLHLRRVPGGRRDVAVLLHHRVGRVGGQGQDGGRGLQAPRHHHARQGVRLLRGSRRGGVRVRRPQRGAGDPGHHPVHAGEAVQEAHVEGCRGGLHRRRALLLPRRPHRLLGLRQQRGRQHPHHPQQAQVAHRHGQHDGRHPRHRELPDLRHARVRHDRDGAGEEDALPSRPHAPLDCPEPLRCLHHVRRYHLPFLRWAARILRRLRLRAHHILPPLRHVARHLQAQKIQSLVVYQLGLHRPWSVPHDPVANRRAQTDHLGFQDIQILLIDCFASTTYCLCENCKRTSTTNSLVLQRKNEKENHSTTDCYRWDGRCIFSEKTWFSQSNRVVFGVTCVRNIYGVCI